MEDYLIEGDDELLSFFLDGHTSGRDLSVSPPKTDHDLLISPPKYNVNEMNISMANLTASGNQSGMSSGNNSSTEAPGNIGTFNSSHTNIPEISPVYTGITSDGITTASSSLGLNNQIPKMQNRQVLKKNVVRRKSSSSKKKQTKGFDSNSHLHQMQRDGSFASAMTAEDDDDEAGMDGVDDEGKRLKRLARNRESARQSRRRKKRYLEQLENKVAKLAFEVDALRRQHIVTAFDSQAAQRKEILSTLTVLANDPSRHHEIKPLIRHCDALFGSNSEDRRILLDYHYNHINNLLLPAHTKFLLWIMNQGEKFFKANDDNGMPVAGIDGLWPLISVELNLSKEQQERFRQNFKALDSATNRQERWRLYICSQLLEQLRRGIMERSAVVQQHTDRLFEILTPVQCVKYLRWQYNNENGLNQCGYSALSALNFNSSQSISMQYCQQILLKPDETINLNDIAALVHAITQ